MVSISVLCGIVCTCPHDELDRTDVSYPHRGTQRVKEAVRAAQEERMDDNGAAKPVVKPGHGQTGAWSNRSMVKPEHGQTGAWSNRGVVIPGRGQTWEWSNRGVVKPGQGQTWAPWYIIDIYQEYSTH